MKSSNSAHAQELRSPQLTRHTPTTTSTLLKLPSELKYQIFDILISTPHTIIIYPKSRKHGFLTSLYFAIRLSCRQLKTDLEQYLEKSWNRNASRLMKSHIFGVFNHETTTFKLSYQYCHRHASISMRRRVYHRMQRCIAPSEITNEQLHILELWQRAMTKCNSDQIKDVNNAAWSLLGRPIDHHGYPWHPFFLAVQTHYRPGTGLSPPTSDYQAYDRRVRDPKSDLCYGTRRIVWNFVWSVDFENHSQHQEFIDPYEGRTMIDKIRALNDREEVD